MHVSSRLQCALVAATVFPCWASAQSSLLGRTDVAPLPAASQLSVTPINAGVDFASPPGADIAVHDVVALPAADLTADPIPATTSDVPLNSAPANEQALGAGPTTSSATAGIRSHSADENLTQRQLLDRANHQDDGGRSGLGRDAVLMIVGGAAIVAGAIVGGGGGTALIVVGAVVGLTGLVLILS